MFLGGNWRNQSDMGRTSQSWYSKNFEFQLLAQLWSIPSEGTSFFFAIHCRHLGLEIKRCIQDCRSEFKLSFLYMHIQMCLNNLEHGTFFKWSKILERDLKILAAGCSLLPRCDLVD